MLRVALNRSCLAALIAMFLSGSACAKADCDASQLQAAARAEILATLGAFRRAIIAKDEAGFLALFNAGPVVWQSVDSVATLIAKGMPGREPAFRDPGKTPQSFIRNIARTEAAIDETMTDIRVDTDGEIATVNFDFVYSRDGAPTNQGLESWHLLRTGAGWRIVSVVWSNHPPARR